MPAPIELDSLPGREAAFIEPMECFAVAKVPDDTDWLYEIKLDGYRAIAVNSHGNVILYSRRRKNFNRQYPFIAEALKELPENTVVDGEVVALDDAGRPNFNLLQHSRSQASRICYFIFDLLAYKNRDLTHLSLNGSETKARSHVRPYGRVFAPHRRSNRYSRRGVF